MYMYLYFKPTIIQNITTCIKKWALMNQFFKLITTEIYTPSSEQIKP